MSLNSVYSNDQFVLDYDYFKIASIMTIIKAKGLYENKPMLSLPFLDWFDSYDFSKFSFVEVGSGNSTNYFAQRVKDIISFETDIDFYNKLKPELLNNVDYRFIKKDDLENKKLNIPINKETIVFIDCAANRFLTTKNIFKIGLPNIIILDNSDSYKNTCKLIYDKGYSEIPFWGIRLTETEEACTSVFIKNNFNMIEKKYSYFSVGSIVREDEVWDRDV